MEMRDAKAICSFVDTLDMRVSGIDVKDEKVLVYPLNSFEPIEFRRRNVKTAEFVATSKRVNVGGKGETPSEAYDDLIEEINKVTRFLKSFKPEEETNE